MVGRPLYSNQVMQPLRFAGGIGQYRQVVTSASTSFSCTRSLHSLMKSSSKSLHQYPQRLTSGRPYELKKHLAASSLMAAEYNMSSDNPQSHNNDDFRLSNLFNVKGRVALITGAGSGIGLMATQALAVNGAKVYICGRTEEKYWL